MKQLIFILLKSFIDEIKIKNEYSHKFNEEIKNIKVYEKKINIKSIGKLNIVLVFFIKIKIAN